MKDFNIKFYLKDIPNAQELPIQVGIYYNSDKARPATGLMVRPDHWKAEKEIQYITEGDPEYKSKNQELKRHAAFLTDFMKNNEDGPEFKEKLKQAYTLFKKPYLAFKEKAVKKEKHLLEYFREWVCGRAGIAYKDQDHVTFLEQLVPLVSVKIKEEDKNKMKVSGNTLKNDRSTYNTLYTFESAAIYPLYPSSITFAFEEKFNEYILFDLQHDIDTYSKHIGIIKKFCTWLRKVKKVKDLEEDYDEFKRPTDIHDELVPLEPEELTLLYNRCFINPILDRERLIFLTLCSIGQHITDYNDHLPKALEEKFDQEGHEYLLLRRQKNKYPYIIPYFDSQYLRPVECINELIKRYGKLPRVSEGQLNDALVDICKEVGIQRQITTKYGRKTFASIHTYEYHTPKTLTMKATGHTTERSFNIYLGIRPGRVVAGIKQSTGEK